MARINVLKNIIDERFLFLLDSYFDFKEFKQRVILEGASSEFSLIESKLTKKID